MPISIRYTWSETIEVIMLELKVPPKVFNPSAEYNVLRRGVVLPDVSLTAVYVKVNNPPHFFEVDLWGEIDHLNSGTKAWYDQSEQILKIHLFKAEKGIWGQLSKVNSGLGKEPIESILKRRMDNMTSIMKLADITKEHEIKFQEQRNNFCEESFIELKDAKRKSIVSKENEAKSKMADEIFSEGRESIDLKAKTLNSTYMDIKDFRDIFFQGDRIPVRKCLGVYELTYFEDLDSWFHFKKTAYTNILKKDFEGAIVEYSKLLEKKKSVTALSNRALCYLLLSQFNKSIDDCKEALSILENSSYTISLVPQEEFDVVITIYYRLAIASIWEGDTLTATNSLKKLVSLYEFKSEKRKETLLKDLENFKQSIKIYQEMKIPCDKLHKIIKKNGFDKSLLDSMIIKYDKFIERCELKLNSMSGFLVVAYSNKAQMLLLAKMYFECIQMCEKAIETIENFIIQFTSQFKNYSYSKAFFSEEENLKTELLIRRFLSVESEGSTFLRNHKLFRNKLLLWVKIKLRKLHCLCKLNYSAEAYIEAKMVLIVVPKNKIALETILSIAKKGIVNEGAYFSLKEEKYLNREEFIGSMNYKRLSEMGKIVFEKGFFQDAIIYFQAAVDRAWNTRKSESIPSLEELKAKSNLCLCYQKIKEYLEVIRISSEVILSIEGFENKEFCISTLLEKKVLTGLKQASKLRR